MPVSNIHLTTLTVFLGATVAIGLTIGWVYQTHLKIADVPLIKAEAGPEKYKPFHEGGMSIPNRDMLVWSLRVKRPPRKVTLAPLPEEPIELPKRLAANIKERVFPKDLVSWMKDVEVSEVGRELHRIRLASLANRSQLPKN